MTRPEGEPSSRLHFQAPDLIRLLLALAWVFAALGLLYAGMDQWPYWTESLNRGQPFGRDAYNFWTAARMCHDGACAQIYDRDAFTQVQTALIGPSPALNCYLYPPPALIVMGAMGFLPYAWALALWSLLGVITFLCATITPRIARSALLAALLAPMLLFNLIMGQSGLLAAALLIGGLRLSASRPMLAGCLLGLLSFKPMLAVLVPLLLVLRGQWRTLLAAAVATVLLAILPALIWGEGVWHAFFADALPLQQVVLQHGSGIGVFMIPSAFNSARLLGWSSADAFLVQAGVAVATLALLGGHAWRTRGQRVIDTADILLLTVATGLLSPYIHNYDLAMIEGALVLWVHSRPAFQNQSGHWRALFAVALLWTVGILSFVLNAAALPLGPPMLFIALCLLSAGDGALASALPENRLSGWFSRGV